MIGRSFWIVIWYVILGLGAMGLWGGIYWGRKSRWNNLDEIFRGIGTISVSVGMLILLYGRGEDNWIDEILLIFALFAFVGAFIVGRRNRNDQSAGHHLDDDDQDPS
jgi:hypothetical protein